MPNGQGTGAPGYAPKADLMFVDATSPMVAGTTEAGKGMGESDNIIDAVRYIFERSNGRPTVVNLSLGTHAGPHDGKGLIERSIDTLVDAEPNRAVVIAAGLLCEPRWVTQIGKDLYVKTLLNPES